MPHSVYIAGTGSFLPGNPVSFDDINGKSTHLAAPGALTFNTVLQDFSRRSLLDFFSTSNAAIHALKMKRWKEMRFNDDTL